MIDYLLSLVSVSLCFGMGAMALDVIFGRLGSFHLGSGFLFGMGAYAYALAAPVAPWLALLLSGLIGGLTSCAVVLPFLQITQRPRFLFVALALQLVAFELFNNAQDLTHGAAGIGGIPPLMVAGYPLEASGAGLGFILLLATVLGCGISWWSRTRAGRAVDLVRQDELLAVELGVRPAVAKLQALAVGGAGLGLAGAAYAALVGFVSPRDGGLDVTIALTVMVLVAPRARPWLITAGGAAVYMLPEVARFLGDSGPLVPAARNVLFGVLLVAIGLMQQRRSMQ